MMTREEIKEKAATCIRIHGQSINDMTGLCSYRQSAKADDPVRCGIGALIEDAYYIPEWDDANSVNSLHSCITDAKQGMASGCKLSLLWAIQSSNIDVSEHQELLMMIQQIHDEDGGDGLRIAERIMRI